VSEPRVLAVHKWVLTVGLTMLIVQKTLSAMRGTSLIPEGAKVKIVRRRLRVEGVKVQVFVALLIKGVTS